MHVSGHFEQSVDMMRHSIAILEALDIAFPVSQSLTASVRGATFVPSVLRGFLLLLGHIIIYVSPSGLWTNSGLGCIAA